MKFWDTFSLKKAKVTLFFFLFTDYRLVCSTVFANGFKIHYNATNFSLDFHFLMFSIIKYLF